VAEIFVWNGGGQGEGKLNGISWSGRLGGEGNKEGGSDWVWMREGGGVPLGAGFGDAVRDRWPAAHGHCRGGRRLGHVSRGVGCRWVGSVATVPGGGEILISNFKI
jgi:hypothetical protein